MDKEPRPGPQYSSHLTGYDNRRLEGEIWYCEDGLAGGDSTGYFRARIEKALAEKRARQAAGTWGKDAPLKQLFGKPQR